MANGKSTLDREGCEYGRSLKLENDILREYTRKQLEETKKTVEKAEKTLNEIKERQVVSDTKSDLKGWEHYVAIAVIDLVVTGMGFWVFSNILVQALE